MDQAQARPPLSPYTAYLAESRRPFTILFFLFPVLVLYHIGVWLIREFGEIPWANGADVLLARGLERLGLGGPLVSLFVVVATLLFLQQATGAPWRFRTSTLVLMALESLLFALPPFLLGKAVGAVLLAAGAGGGPGLFVEVVLSLGAGVYEEFLFRMILLTALLWLAQRIAGSKGAVVLMVAVLAQALLFALFHHLPGSHEPFALDRFAFRTVCGVYFAYLYQERGLGIAAGSHALYDLLAVMLNAAIRT